MIPTYVAWRSPRCRGWREEDPTGAQYAVRMFSYTPAAADRDAWGLITDRFVLTIATDAGHALELWRTMTTPDATLESILEALVTRGVRVIPDFALIELLDASTGSASPASSSAPRRLRRDQNCTRSLCRSRLRPNKRSLQDRSSTLEPTHFP